MTMIHDPRSLRSTCIRAIFKWPDESLLYITGALALTVLVGTLTVKERFPSRYTRRRLHPHPVYGNYRNHPDYDPAWDNFDPSQGHNNLTDGMYPDNWGAAQPQPKKNGFSSWLMRGRGKWFDKKERDLKKCRNPECPGPAPINANNVTEIEMATLSPNTQHNNAGPLLLLDANVNAADTSTDTSNKADKHSGFVDGYCKRCQKNLKFGEKFSHLKMERGLSAWEILGGVGLVLTGGLTREIVKANIDASTFTDTIDASSYTTPVNLLFLLLLFGLFLTSGVNRFTGSSVLALFTLGSATVMSIGAYGMMFHSKMAENTEISANGVEFDVMMGMGLTLLLPMLVFVFLHRTTNTTTAVMGAIFAAGSSFTIMASSTEKIFNITGDTYQYAPVGVFAFAFAALAIIVLIVKLWGTTKWGGGMQHTWGKTLGAGVSVIAAGGAWAGTTNWLLAADPNAAEGQNWLDALDFGGLAVVLVGIGIIALAMMFRHCQKGGDCGFAKIA